MQIASTADRFSSRSSKPGRAAWARPANSRSASSFDRPDGVLSLGREVQRLAARDNELEIRACGAELAERRSGRGKQLLHIVQQEDHSLRLQMPSECVLDSLSGRLSNLERLCDGWQEQSRIHHSGKADEPHAVWIRIDELGHSLQSQTRLPGAARTRECQQAHVLSPEQVEHLGEFALAAEERCRLHGQVGLVEALEWRELALPELEDSLGLLQVLEPVESKVADLCVDESTSRLRKQHLATVAAGGDARALVHVEADIALRSGWARPCAGPCEPGSGPRRACPGPTVQR